MFCHARKICKSLSGLAVGRFESASPCRIAARCRGMERCWVPCAAAFAVARPIQFQTGPPPPGSEPPRTPRRRCCAASGGGVVPGVRLRAATGGEVRQMPPGFGDKMLSLHAGRMTPIVHESTSSQALSLHAGAWRRGSAGAGRGQPAGRRSPKCPCAGADAAGAMRTSSGRGSCATTRAVKSSTTRAAVPAPCLSNLIDA